MPLLRRVAVLIALHVGLYVLACLTPNDPSAQVRSHLNVEPQILSLSLDPGRLLPALSVAAAGPNGPVRTRLRLLCSALGSGAPSERLNRFSLYCVDSSLRFYPLGTDALGRCRFSRVIHGGVTSLSIAMGSTAIAISLGLLVGLFGALAPPLVDRLVTMLVDVGRSLPWLLVVLALRARSPLHLPPLKASLALVAVLGLSGWFTSSRLVRSRVRQLLSEPWMLAARSVGGHPLGIGLRHLIPNVTSLVMTQALTLMPAFIIAETSLSFLGLGIGDPGVSWGSLLGDLRHRDIVLSHPVAWIVLLPLIIFNMAYQWTSLQARAR